MSVDPELNRIDVQVRRLQVSGLGRKDHVEDVARLRDVLADYIWASAPYGEVYAGRAHTDAPAPMPASAPPATVAPSAMSQPSAPTVPPGAVAAAVAESQSLDDEQEAAAQAHAGRPFVSEDEPEPPTVAAPDGHAQAPVVPDTQAPTLASVDGRNDLAAAAAPATAAGDAAARDVESATADAAPTARARERLVVDVVIRLDRANRRTVVADIATSIVGGAFSPNWGRVEATLVMTVSDANGREVARRELSVTERYVALWYTWFRRGYVEDAYTAAYQELFTAAARELATSTGAYLAAKREERGAAVAAAASPEPTPDAGAGGGTNAPANAVALLNEVPEAPGVPRRDASEEATRTALALPDPVGPRPSSAAAPVAVTATTPPDDSDSFGLIRTKPRSTSGPIWAAIQLLGGVEATAFWGFARVASQIEMEDGRKLDIAEGRASQQGYRVALYSAPEVTGFFVYPTLGYMQQTIAIADFAATLPRVEVAGGQEIEATCSDPETYQSLDCAAANIYDLEMKSGFGGVRAGFNLVLGNPHFVMFGSATIGANLVEYREITATVAEHYQGTRHGWDFFKSLAAGATLGFKIPELHTALRGIVDFEYYPGFTYADPLEFKGFVVYNEEKQAYERPRMYVDGARLMACSFQLALAITF